jgi:ABC-type glycerol-3-phosphate transport system permease component
MRSRTVPCLVYGLAVAVALVFLYPFYWMLMASFRSQAAILSEPLRPWPETFDTGGFEALRSIGGVSIWTFVSNSLVITGLATVLGVAVTGLGAYALYRNPRLPLFSLIRYGFLIKIMYPSMMLAIPLYFVAYQLGLLGRTVGIVLAISSVPLVFFMFLEFFRSVPSAMIEAAVIDGASELQILAWIVIPLARPVMLTGILISFLINWKQWFPIMVLSTGPETYTLQVALISLNSELGVNFQAIMALAVLTVLPVTLLFVLTQRWVMEGFMVGSIKG